MRPGPLTPHAAERRLYLLTATRWLPVGFVVGIFILVQTGRGLTVAQAATAAAVSGIVCFLLELPTSGFADAVGRRPVYLTAAALNVVALTAYALAQSFWAFVLAAGLMGAFRALDSGPLEAWFVDAVHESQPGADVDRQLARAGSILGAAIALGAVLSGLLIWWDPANTVLDTGASALDAAVWTSVALSVVHLVAAAVVMREARPAAAEGRTRWAHATGEARRTPAVIASGLRLLRDDRVLLGLVGAEVAWSIGMITFESLMPLRLEEMVGSAREAGALVGPVSAAGWGMFSVGAWLAGRTSARVGVARAAIVGRVLNALGAVVMGLVVGPVGLVVAYLFTYAMHGMNGPPHAALLHREATASNRSTVLSINSMMAFLAFAIAAPPLGALADRTSISTAMVTAGALSILGVLGYLPARRSERARSAAGAGSDPPAG
ncbi:MAG: MFS transporter [Candidatus Nanopelagicales bacterium]|jgi:MFS family permease|nr:MFS transporter [Candidatus Nanopelagicales bacterium]